MSDRLSHSCPTCPECKGKGVLGGCGSPTCDHAHTFMFCPSCLGGYPREAVERAAKAIIEWEIDNGYLVSHVTEAEAMALAAIRAFHELDIICDGNCDHAVHQPDRIAERARQLTEGKSRNETCGEARDAS